MPAAKRPRKLTDESQDRLKSCIGTSSASDGAVRAIWNKAAMNGDQVNPTTFKRYVAETLQPALDCFDRFEVPAMDDESVEIFVANMEKTVVFIGREMPSLADLLAGPLQQGLRLHPILYHDEAIASNPLSTEKQMKSMLVYMSWKELKRSLFLEDVWLPVCCIQSMDLDRIPSGFNGIMSLLVQHLLSPRWQEGFACNLILGFWECVVSRYRGTSCLIPFVLPLLCLAVSPL